MKKLTQKQIVINQLLKNGKISRNWCLQNYISRLSAIIQTLEEEGWIFTTGFIENNFVYTAVKCPLTKVVFTLPNGETITTYKMGFVIINDNNQVDTLLSGVCNY